MTIRDRVFGTHTITSPVIIELILSKPMQRLKGIGQAGQPEETDPRPYRSSRYDHSLGVMLLLRHLGASEEEQIAGLLHDVSHTAFSHTIDIVLGRGKAEDFQDSQHEQYILNSEIPNILEKYGYKTERVYDYHHFTLLEQDLPALCADRVDYSFRESSRTLINACLPYLKAHKGKIVFTDVVVARKFSDQFLYLQRTHWGGAEHVIREQLFAKALRRALDIKIISIDDFWKDDAYILAKLHGNEDMFIRKIFAMIKRKSFSKLPVSTDVVQKKFRFIDPEVLSKNSLFKLSEIDVSYIKELEEAKKNNEKGITIPGIS